MSKTAWGEVLLRYTEMTADETMPTSLEEMGEVMEDSLGLELEDGTKLQLFKEGHVLVDELEQEPILYVNATLIGIPDKIKQEFWETEKTGEVGEEKYAVKSLVNTKKFAVDFAAIKVKGSDTFEAPKCSVKLGPLYSSAQGWTSQVRITVIKAKTGTLFQFGKVA